MSQKIILGVSVVAVLLFVGVVVWDRNKPGEYDQLAQCIADSGATFYGAFWCPHCQEQKASFGNSQKYLPYVECSLPSGQGQTEECETAGITGYPTWEFANGDRLSGEQTPEVLAEKTNCPL